MKRVIFVLMFILLTGTTMFAQQSLFGGQEIVSPEIHENNSVTFRVEAPDATKVTISGDWMPAQGFVPGSAEMEKDEKGIWSYTTDELIPELYSYTFTVDGFKSTDPNNPFIVRDVASIMNIFIIGGGQADLYKVNDIAHGTLAYRWYDSPGLQMDRKITVYTPPGYESSNEKYPVLYLLHGAGGDEEAWLTLGRATQILDNLIAQGKANPMIVVMPNGNVTQDAAPGSGSDGFYKPQFMAPKTMDGTYEVNFMDIIKFVESNYRVLNDKKHRAIAGLSMGGFHSLHISRYYPNTFDYVGLFSAAIMASEDATEKVYSNFNETLKNQMENGYKVYWIGIGKEDFLYQANKEFRQKLDDMGMKYTYMETEGGHVWKNWRMYLSEFAPLLFK